MEAEQTKQRELSEPKYCFEDEGHYPNQEALDYIEHFDITKKSTTELIAFVKRLWWMPDWGFKMIGKKVFYLELHTGGWSGNESIIQSLRANIFWSCFWRRSTAGGHYYFKFKELHPELLNQL